MKVLPRAYLEETRDQERHTDIAYARTMLVSPDRPSLQDIRSRLAATKPDFDATLPTRNRYTDEQLLEAVERWNGPQPIQEVANEMGISRWQLQCRIRTARIRGMKPRSRHFKQQGSAS